MDHAVKRTGRLYGTTYTDSSPVQPYGLVANSYDSYTLMTSSLDF